MGIVRFWRNFLRKVCPSAFYPHAGPSWPDTSVRPIRVFIVDVNSLVREKPLCITAKGTRIDHGFRTWGELTSALNIEFQRLFSQGARRLYLVFDGKTPENKGSEQRKREENWKRGFDRANAQRVEGEPEYKPYEWPRTDDGQPWFRADMPVFCSFNDIYYGGALSKTKFYEFLTSFFLYEMPLPVGAEVVVDCGALPGHGMLRAPVCARIVTVALTCADATALAQQGVAELERRVETCAGEAAYCTYTEADDRLVYWTYLRTLNSAAPDDVMVISEDGDTMLALMCTYYTRRHLRPAGRYPGRVYWRRSENIGRVLNSDGSKRDVTQPEWINTDVLAEQVDQFMVGLVQRQQFGVYLFCALALMCKNDYVEGFRGLSDCNLMLALLKHPDKATRMLSARVPDGGAEHAPHTVLIHAEAARDFIRHAYAIAYANRVSKKLYPVPPDDSIDVTMARVSWTLDKSVNAGRPQYRLAFPFLVASPNASNDEESLPVYGYEMEMVKDKDGKEKKRAFFSDRVLPQAWFGVRHAQPSANQ